MSGTAAVAAAVPASLGFGEQIARDARTRVVAAGCVVLVHSSYAPGSAALSGHTGLAATLEPVLFTLFVTFPVNTFVLLAFLQLSLRVQRGAPSGQLLRTTVRRLLPAHLFWTTAFLASNAALAARAPSGRDLLEAYALGHAADHLYFLPVLMALTAAVPLLAPLARKPGLAVATCAAMAVASISLHQATASPWVRALAGCLGLAPFALAGLTLGRWWSGTAPTPALAARLLPWAGVAAVVSGCTLVSATLAGVRGFDPTAWFAALAFAFAVPLLLIAPRTRVPPWVMKVAPLTLGVYLIHPFFTKGLRLAEASLAPGNELAFLLPNIAAAMLLSVGSVMLLHRTPLRRFM